MHTEAVQKVIMAFSKPKLFRFDGFIGQWVKIPPLKRGQDEVKRSPGGWPRWTSTLQIRYKGL